MLSHDVLHKQPKSCKRKHETLLFKSYSEKNTFGVIIYIFASINTKNFKILATSYCKGISYLPILVTRHGAF